MSVKQKPPTKKQTVQFFLVQKPIKVMNNTNTINNEDDQVLVFNQKQFYNVFYFRVKNNILIIKIKR